MFEQSASIVPFCGGIWFEVSAHNGISVFWDFAALAQELEQC